MAAEVTWRGVCGFCGEEVTSLQSAAYRVRGWQLEAKPGHVGKIVDVERQSDRIAHRLCVERTLRTEGEGLRGQMMFSDDGS